MEKFEEEEEKPKDKTEKKEENPKPKPKPTSKPKSKPKLKTKDKEDKEDKEEEEFKKEVKETFKTFSRTAELLRPGWRDKGMPSINEKYDGSIQGYNCGEYSEFAFQKAKNKCLNFGECDQEFITPGNKQSDYLFPGRRPNKTNSPKYAAKPRMLDYENDVNDKILEYESMNVLPDYKPEEVAHLERPNYTYHRGDGTDDPIITDWNRFEVGQINTGRRRTPQYSVL